MAFTNSAFFTYLSCIVILKPGDYEQWLNPEEKNTSKLQKLLISYPPEEMTSHPVSRAVNITSSNSAELIASVNSL